MGVTTARSISATNEASARASVARSPEDPSVLYNVVEINPACLRLVDPTENLRGLGIVMTIVFSLMLLLIATNFILFYDTATRGYGGEYLAFVAGGSLLGVFGLWHSSSGAGWWRPQGRARRLFRCGWPSLSRARVASRAASRPPGSFRRAKPPLAPGSSSGATWTKSPLLFLLWS